MSKATELRELIDGIRTSINSGEAPRKIVEGLIRERGARHSFNCGADHLRLAGVRTSCTNENGLLFAWVRAAERRIAKELAQ